VTVDDADTGPYSRPIAHLDVSRVAYLFQCIAPVRQHQALVRGSAIRQLRMVTRRQSVVMWHLSHGCPNVPR
jgi:hypothetical protein